MDVTRQHNEPAGINTTCGISTSTCSPGMRAKLYGAGYESPR